jgi:hypothetical protein
MEDNKLIAEFMGMTTSENDESMMIFKTPKGNEIIYTDKLKYHTSWDWLMSVLQKCRQENQLEYFDKVYYALEECDINLTYKAVVEFIKNQNK